MPTINTTHICGPCHFTVDRSQEKTADAIIIRNEELGVLVRKGDHDEGTFPNIDKRNLTQNWVFLNKESAIKANSQPQYMPQEYDNAFNLTISYRQDSDVTRSLALRF